MFKSKKITKISKALSILAIFLVIFVIFNQTSKNSKENDTVKVISWWGYFSNQEQIDTLNNNCGIKLEVAEYLTASELLSLSKTNSFDIYVYPLMYANELEPLLAESSVDISDIPESYPASIYNRYKRAKLEKNTAFFQDGLEIFVYDKNVIPDLQALEIEDLLKISKTGKVFLQNDFKQINWLFSKSKQSSHKEIWNQLDHLYMIYYTQGASHTGFQFSNYSQDFYNVNLTIGFLDSGEILNPNVHWERLEDKKIDFGIHSTLSNVSTDVLSIRSDSKEAICAAREISSREFLTKVSEENYYFNPYGIIPENFKGQLKNFTEYYYKNIDTIPWAYADLLKLKNNKPLKEKWEKLSDCHHNQDCSAWLSLASKSKSLKVAPIVSEM